MSDADVRNDNFRPTLSELPLTNAIHLFMLSYTIGISFTNQNANYENLSKNLCPTLIVSHIKFLQNWMYTVIKRNLAELVKIRNATHYV